LTDETVADLAAKLAPAHFDFANAWLEHGVSVRAFHEAGFFASTPGSAKAGASRIRNRPDVVAYINAMRNAVSESTGVTLERIDRELEFMAFGRLDDVAEWTEEEVEDEAQPPQPPSPPGMQAPQPPQPPGMARLKRYRKVLRIRPSSELTDAEAATVQEVGYTQTGFKIKQYDKKAALDMLIKRKGGYTDNLQISGPGGGPIQTEVVVDKETLAKISEML
jgi:hypothetical protein